MKDHPKDHILAKFNRPKAPGPETRDFDALDNLLMQSKYVRIPKRLRFFQPSVKFIQGSNVMAAVNPRLREPGISHRSTAHLFRWKCGHCETNFCDNCEATQPHDRTHIFLKISHPILAGIALFSYSLNSSGNLNDVVLHFKQGNTSEVNFLI